MCSVHLSFRRRPIPFGIDEQLIDAPFLHYCLYRWLAEWAEPDERTIGIGVSLPMCCRTGSIKAGTLPGRMEGSQTCRFNELGIGGAAGRVGYRKLQFTGWKL